MDNQRALIYGSPLGYGVCQMTKPQGNKWLEQNSFIIEVEFDLDELTEVSGQ